MDYTNPTAEESSPAVRIQQVIDFWNGLSVDDDSGETTGEVLEDLRLQVTDALFLALRHLGVAESLTAKAALLITGRNRP